MHLKWGQEPCGSVEPRNALHVIAGHLEDTEMSTRKSSEEMIPQADKQAHTEIADRAGRHAQQAPVADDKKTMSSEEAIPQADKQAHTEIAERAGREAGKT